jgi:subtilisin family serine protease
MLLRAFAGSGADSTRRTFPALFNAAHGNADHDGDLAIALQIRQFTHLAFPGGAHGDLVDPKAAPSSFNSASKDCHVIDNALHLSVHPGDGDYGYGGVAGPGADAFPGLDDTSRHSGLLATPLTVIGQPATAPDA